MRSAPGWGRCFSPEKRRVQERGAESRWGSGQHRSGPGRAGRPRTQTRGWRWPRGVLPARCQGELENRGPGWGANSVSPLPLSASHVGVGSVPAGLSGICREPASGGEARTGRGGWKLSFSWRGRRGARRAGRLGHCPQRVHFCQAGVGCYSEEGRGERERERKKYPTLNQTEEHSSPPFTHPAPAGSAPRSQPK